MTWCLRVLICFLLFAPFTNAGPLEEFHKVLENRDEGAALRALRSLHMQRSERTKALYIASANGLLEVAKILVEKMADVNARSEDGQTPLHAAAGNGSLEMVDFLLSVKATINVSDSQGRSPMQVALASEHKLIVERLILASAQADPAQLRIDALFQEAANGGLNVVEYLLADNPSFLNACDERGRTLLHLAAAHGHDQLAAFLISKGADTDKRDKTGNTASHHAAKGNSWNILVRLIAAGAELRIQNDQFQTPLAIADKRLHARESGVTNRPQTPRGEARSQIVTASPSSTPPDSPTAQRPKLSSKKLRQSLNRIGVLGTGAAAAAAACDAPRDPHQEAPPLRRQTIDAGPSHVALPALRLSGSKLAASVSCDQSSSSSAGAIPAPPLSMIESLVVRGDVATLRRLHDNRHFNPGMLCTGEATLLHHAATHGQLEVIFFLVGADIELVNFPDANGVTPLHRAAENGHLIACALLIQYGANVLAETLNGFTFIEIAKAEGFTELKTLIQQIFPSTMLALVKAGKEDQVLHSLLYGTRFEERVAETDEDGSNLFHHLILAAGEGAKKSQSIQASQNLPAQTPRTTIETLLAAQCGALRELVNLADGNGETPLHLAALRNRPDLIALLLNAGAHLNTVDKMKSTPLNLAARQNKEAAAIFLVQRRADPNMKDELGCTPLHWAAFHNSAPLISALVPCCAEILYCDTTPLHIAAEMGHDHALAVMLEGDFDLDPANKEGDRPLHLAARHQRFLSARILILRGADVAAKNRLHHTPYDVMPNGGRVLLDGKLRQLKEITELCHATARAKFQLGRLQANVRGSTATAAAAAADTEVDTEVDTEAETILSLDPEDEAREIADNMPMEEIGEMPWILVALHPSVVTVIRDAVMAALITHLGSLTSRRRT